MDRFTGVLGCVAQRAALFILAIPAPVWAEKATTVPLRTVRAMGGAAFSVGGPAGEVAGALGRTPGADGASHRGHELFLVALEVRVPGTRGLWLRAQRSSGAIGESWPTYRECGFSLLGCDGDTVQMRSESYGLIALVEQGRVRVGLGPSWSVVQGGVPLVRPTGGLDEYLDSPKSNRWGLIGDVRFRATPKGRFYQCDLGFQHHWTGRAEVGLRGPWDTAVRKDWEQTVRPAFRHGQLFAEMGLAF